MYRSLPAAALMVSAGLTLAACGGSSGSSGSSGSGSSTPAGSSSAAATGSITVLAASSLTKSFTTLGQQFEAAHPGTTVTFSFDASSALATQITNGAPADVFASASAKNMASVVTAGDATGPKNFATNIMEVAVPPNNPAGITSVTDLAKSGVKVALCQAQVPCGVTAYQVFKNAGITVKPVTEEANVASTLTKVESGEVDAGVVYVTDVQGAGDKVKGIEIPANLNASTEYPIAALKDSKNPTVAQEFIDYILSADGQSVLKTAGFEAPAS